MEDIQSKHLPYFLAFFKQFPRLSPCTLAKILHKPNVTSFGKFSGISLSFFEKEA